MRIGQLAQLAFIALSAAAVFQFVTVARESEARRACIPLCATGPAYAALDRVAPDFELKDLGGRPVRLSSYRGKTVVLNFWTKSCRPCLEEMPALVELGKLLAQRKDTVLLTVSTDATVAEVRDTVNAIAGRDAAGLAVLVDADADVVGGKYGTKLYPETWIIDPEGVIRARFDGARDWTNPVVLELVDSVARPVACPVVFEEGRPRGQSAGYCDEVSGDQG